MATYGAVTNTPGMEATTTCWQNKSFVDDLWDREGSGGRPGLEWDQPNFDLQKHRGTFDCLLIGEKKVMNPKKRNNTGP